MTNKKQSHKLIFLHYFFTEMIFGIKNKLISLKKKEKRSPLDHQASTNSLDVKKDAKSNPPRQ